jgi:hypothetical protein
VAVVTEAIANHAAGRDPAAIAANRAGKIDAHVRLTRSATKTRSHEVRLVRDVFFVSLCLRG